MGASRSLQALNNSVGGALGVCQCSEAVLCLSGHKPCERCIAEVEEQAATLTRSAPSPATSASVGGPTQCT
eukprot:4160060-Amphidinium_carterae.1